MIDAWWAAHEIEVYVAAAMCSALVVGSVIALALGWRPFR